MYIYKDNSAKDVWVFWCKRVLKYNPMARLQQMRGLRFILHVALNKRERTFIQRKFDQH